MENTKSYQSEDLEDITEPWRGFYKDHSRGVDRQGQTNPRKEWVWAVLAAERRPVWLNIQKLLEKKGIHSRSRVRLWRQSFTFICSVMRSHWVFRGRGAAVPDLFLSATDTNTCDEECFSVNIEKTLCHSISTCALNLEL